MEEHEIVIDCFIEQWASGTSTTDYRIKSKRQKASSDLSSKKTQRRDKFSQL